jgi:hypothetical protein
MRSIAVAGAEQRPEPSGPQTDTSAVPSVEGVREGGLAEVIALAHARDACMPSLAGEIKHACIDDAFADLVKPIGLVGPNRDVCLDAYREAPEAFAGLVDAALLRGRSPAALLVRMVKCGDHRKLAASATAPPVPETGPSLLEQRMAEHATRAARGTS